MPKEDDSVEVSQGATEMHHRHLFDGESEDPATEWVETVAELRGVDQHELDPLYSWADNLVCDLYSSPPPPEAQAVVEFSYEGYRITLYQDGHAVLIRRSGP